MNLAPEDERVLRMFLETLADAGDYAGAVRTYENFVAALLRELGNSAFRVDAAPRSNDPFANWLPVDFGERTGSREKSVARSA